MQAVSPVALGHCVSSQTSIPQQVLCCSLLLQFMMQGCCKKKSGAEFSKLALAWHAHCSGVHCCGSGQLLHLWPHPCLSVGCAENKSETKSCLFLGDQVLNSVQPIAATLCMASFGFGVGPATEAPVPGEQLGNTQRPPGGVPMEKIATQPHGRGYEPAAPGKGRAVLAHRLSLAGGSSTGQSVPSMPSAGSCSGCAASPA